MNDRVTQLKEILKEQGLDAALLCLSENVLLMSGYWPRNGFSFLFVPRDGSATLIVPKQDVEDIPADAGLEVETFGWVNLSEGNPYKNLTNVLKKLKKLNDMNDAGTIGIEQHPQAVAPPLCDGEVILPGSATIAAVRAAFPAAEWKDIHQSVTHMRRIKSEYDIEKLERANKIAWEGVEYFKQSVARPGLREVDIAAMVESYVARNAAAHGATYARAWAQVSSGPRTADAWAAGVVTGQRRLEKGDLVLLEMGTVADGYFSDLTMTHYVAKADMQITNMLDVVKRAQNAAIGVVRAGVRAAEVDAMARKVLADMGMDKFFIHNTGHGVGFAYHDGLPVLNPASQDILEEGMVHSVEPGIYIPGTGGVRFEANVLVGSDGARILGTS